MTSPSRTPACDDQTDGRTHKSEATERSQKTIRTPFKHQPTACSSTRTMFRSNEDTKEPDLFVPFPHHGSSTQDAQPYSPSPRVCPHELSGSIVNDNSAFFGTNDEISQSPCSVHEEQDMVNGLVHKKTQPIAAGNAQAPCLN